MKPMKKMLVGILIICDRISRACFVYYIASSTFVRPYGSLFFARLPAVERRCMTLHFAYAQCSSSDYLPK